MQEWLHEVQAWSGFYSFTGTAAATLMGLMFVVMSLGQRTLATEEGQRATRGFFTPIVVFFATVIVVTMLMLIPDPVSSAVGALLAVLAIVGIVYMTLTDAYKIWRANELGVDDLVWYVVLPYVSFIAIGLAAAGVWEQATFGLYTSAAAMLLLLLTGIRNAWDLVVYNIQHVSSD